MLSDNIKKNVEKIKHIAGEAAQLYSRLEKINFASAFGREINLKEKKMIETAIEALFQQARILNSAIPEMIEGISFYKKLDDKKEKTIQSKALLDLKYQSPANGKENKITIKKEDEQKFIENLSRQDSAAKKIIRAKTTEKMNFAAKYINISNRVFRNFSEKMAEKGTFNFVKNDLRKITSPFTLSSYLSVCFFSGIISIAFGFFAMLVMLLVKVPIIYAVIAFFGIPVLVFLLFLFYPSMEKKNLEREIDQELPFLTIYMSAVSTSGIEPSKIFNVISASKDYPSTRREIKKLNNYINFYGYDIVTALRTISKNCPSEKLGQLFDGLSTTITSGGMISEYLNKHSETLLFDYRLEREKYTRLAETFMNIYISIVIAAPMIMMMLFILIGFTGGGGGLLSDPTTMSIMTVIIIAGLNIGFLMFLNSKQPKF